ncbi:hypothetical protein [Siccirubricoccus sp. G192]|uniref:hypothetical protein n=1 Tax=Siccirubricoccus sp. G192 TaxID=2849651 RepID=UPI001C2C330D|nr:hypothetical protein [Siccirubricoccus sp. G192]MBV1800005.1 hypothetical protein [Siccirubricoccus sp. G192]
MGKSAAPLRRRDLGVLAASALTACGGPLGASAQSGGLFAGLSGTVLPAPMPCLSRPGEAAGLVLEGTGAPAGTITVFGQAFRPGQVPRQAQLVAHLADGRLLPTQMDVTRRHPDGSARFAVVSLAAPGLASGRRTGVVLSARPAAAAAPLDLAAGFAERRAILEVGAAGGEPWRADLGALLRSGPAGQRPWQSGPLASQARIVVPVPAAAAGGATSLRLVADVALRADGTLWVDFWLRNDVAMLPGGGPASYAARLLLDGREALRTGPLRQAQYTGWGRLLGTAPGGRPAPVPPLVRPDAASLVEAAGVPRYDLSTGVDEALLARFGAEAAAPAWQVPLGARGLTQYMPMTGGAGGYRPGDPGPGGLAHHRRPARGRLCHWPGRGGRRRALAFLGPAGRLGRHRRLDGHPAPAEALGGLPWRPGRHRGPAPAGGRGFWLDVRHRASAGPLLCALSGDRPAGFPR